MKAKKSLGQNWLHSQTAIRDIVKAGNLRADDLVLEIGPGQGVLTSAILTTEAKVIAVEKDDRLIEFLKDKFSTEIKKKQLTLIHDDILNFDFSNFLKKKKNILKTSSYKLLANIPYYVTGQIIRKFLSEEEIQPTNLVLMLQKEVAKRITSKDNKESLLSIAVKVYGEPKYIKTIPAGAFVPKPKVDSAILAVHNISRKSFQTFDEKFFFDFVHQGFSQKRKQLKSVLELGKEIFKVCHLKEDVRAENLKLSDWFCLLNNPKKNK